MTKRQWEIVQVALRNLDNDLDREGDGDGVDAVWGESTPVPDHEEICELVQDLDQMVETN